MNSKLHYIFSFDELVLLCLLGVAITMAYWVHLYMGPSTTHFAAVCEALHGEVVETRHGPLCIKTDALIEVEKP